MSQSTSIALNIKQNSPNFELEPLEAQPPLFKFKLLQKTLNPPKKNPKDLKNYRTITVTCLFKGCK